MDKTNATKLTVIHLIGFQTTSHTIKALLFLIFLIIYCVTVCGNFLIISLVTFTKALQTPMYFLLTQLSVSDILLITVILPNMLQGILVTGTIKFSYCITQFYFFAVTEGLECYLLTVMSYDRYLAICRPLHYQLIMTHKLCWTIVITGWFLSFSIVLNHVVNILQLQFCGPNTISHFFCDLGPILDLSCTDTTYVQSVVTCAIALFVVIPFLIITVSYAYIIATILKIPSVTGRQKAFSTCSAHLTVVFMYYGTLSCVYLVPTKGQSGTLSKLLALLYTVGTPLLNPIIYSLRNNDLKNVLGKLIKKSINSHFTKN